MLCTLAGCEDHDIWAATCNDSLAYLYFLKFCVHGGISTRWLMTWKFACKTLHQSPWTQTTCRQSKFWVFLKQNPHFLWPKSFKIVQKSPKRNKNIINDTKHIPEIKNKSSNTCKRILKHPVWSVPRTCLRFRQPVCGSANHSACLIEPNRLAETQTCFVELQAFSAEPETGL